MGEIECVLPTIQLGPVTSPLKPCFSDMTDGSPAGSWTGVANPLGKPGVVLRNVAKAWGDGHTTMTTGRDLSLNSTAYCAISIVYMKTGDLVQVGRNLYFQTQMAGSPQNALSTTGGKTLDFVWRNPTLMHRDPLGSIPWGHEMRAIVGQKLANSGGWCEVWYEVDGWPNLNGSPDHRHANIDSYQGLSAHNTIGGYRDKAKGGPYTHYILKFARATTPQRAIQLAGG